MDSFAGIEAFAAVVERGSFTAAATALQTAKSSVSETVRALEERMGVRLLERTTRRVRPTEAGAAFYRHCRRLLDDLASARNEAQAAHKQPAGRLRIGAPTASPSATSCPASAPSSRAIPPSTSSWSRRAAADLVEQGLDLAIRIVEKPEPRLVVRRIATERIVIVGAPIYIAVAGAPIKPRDVLHHRLIGFTPLAWRDTWRIGKETIAVQPRLLIDTTEFDARRGSGRLGLAAVPEWLVVDALVAGQLTRVLGEHATPSGGIYAVYPTNRLLASRVRLFVDHLARDLRQRGLPR